MKFAHWMVFCAAVGSVSCSRRSKATLLDVRTGGSTPITADAGQKPTHSASHRDPSAIQDGGLETQEERTATTDAESHATQDDVKKGKAGSVTLIEAIRTAGCATTEQGKGPFALAGLDTQSPADTCPFPSDSAAEREAVALAFPSGTMPCNGQCFPEQGGNQESTAGPATTRITGSVTSAARGAFTRRDVEQVALLVEGQGDRLPECCKNVNVLLILEAGQLVHAFSFPGAGHTGTVLVKAVDVNLDRVAELVIETTTVWLGVDTTVQVATVQSGRLSWLGAPNGWTVYSRSMQPEEKPLCKTLYVNPGRIPAFSLRRRAGDCE